jgi:hypothetical protein
MYKILKISGFKYRKTNDGSKFLVERGCTVDARSKFLRAVHNLSGNRRPEFYLDETWVKQYH